VYKSIKARLAKWDGEDSSNVLFTAISVLIGLESVFAGSPVVLGIGIGSLVFVCLSIAGTYC
jgi:hypothetical protein